MVRGKKIVSKPYADRNSLIAIATILFLGVFALLIWYKKNKSAVEKFEGEELTEPTVNFPIIIYNGENYSGTKSVIAQGSLKNYRGSVKSLKLLPGKILHVTHTCGGQTTTGTVSKKFVGNVPQFNMCGWVGIFKQLNADWALVNYPLWADITLTQPYIYLTRTGSSTLPAIIQQPQWTRVRSLYLTDSQHFPNYLHTSMYFYAHTSATISIFMVKGDDNIAFVLKKYPASLSATTPSQWVGPPTVVMDQERRIGEHTIPPFQLEQGFAYRLSVIVYNTGGGSFAAITGGMSYLQQFVYFAKDTGSDIDPMPIEPRVLRPTV